ncbi:MAG: InlB B-repeat-containing protein [Clostridiales bacterium]|jgi:uncharacterized repeat protein (TIGR02543 family)|nr:InlB B-repeat-containing protein [Clostridiales bacterium]
MKNKKNLALILILVLVLSAALSSCRPIFGTTEDKDPKSVIRDAYGDEQFKISFSSIGLDTPLADMYYTANSIPKLPTPLKVGYVFAGWFFDSAYAFPYEDDNLYLYMKDITLYAKWIKEEMIANGAYDIEYSASIVDGSVYKGALTDLYGGYGDFAALLIAEEVYIEKSNDSTLLKLHYDCGVTVPWGGTAVYTVNVAAASGSYATVQNRITAETDTVKTVFIEIGKFDMSQTLYLNITYINWSSPTLSDADRDKTVTNYTVAFKITRFIGFSRPFANPNTRLEDGYYLVKTYFGETMLETFNPVYAYLVADSGRYTLIKPFAPYVGLVSTSGAVDEDDYYRRMAIFYRMLSYYEEDLVNPLNEGYFKDITYEFNSDTGKCYYTLDLGTDPRKSLVIQGASSGFMEAASGLGMTGKRLTIEYDTMLKLKTIDYTPLTGDSYMYSDSLHSNPYKTLASGYSKDGYIEENGIARRLVNFFFSYAGSQIDMDTLGTRMYSTKITISPTGDTALLTARDTKTLPDSFSVSAQVYGYDAKGDDLCADSISSQIFGSMGQREKYFVRIGKSFEVGDPVILNEIYAQKVDKYLNFNLVTWQAYRMTNGRADFTKPVTVARTFDFAENVAVLFTANTPDGKKLTLIELALYSAPVVTVEGYDPSSAYASRSSVSIPTVSYSWMGVSDDYIRDLYASGNGADVNPLKVLTCTVNADGSYVLSFRTLDMTSSPPLEFIMTSEHRQLWYEMRNLYNEIYFYKLDFFTEKTESTPTLYPTITKGLDGETWRADSVGYRVDIPDAERSILSYSDTIKILPSAAAYHAVLAQEWYVHYDQINYQMLISSYAVKTDAGVFSGTGPLSTAQFISAIDAITATANYAYLNFVYLSETGDRYTFTFLYKMSFDGYGELVIMPYDAYFTNNTYIFTAPKITGMDGTVIGVGTLTLRTIRSGSYSENFGTDGLVQKAGNGVVATIYRAAMYQFAYQVVFDFDENGNRVFGETVYTTVTMYQYLSILSVGTKITVTYVTDAEHPFSDGETEMTVVYNNTGNVITIDKTPFLSTPDLLFAWGKNSGLIYSDKGMFACGAVITDFITTFNSIDIRLYAMWDAGIVITADRVADITGQANVSKRLYLMTVATYGNVYTVNLSDFDVVVPKGWVHVGWEGVIFSDGFTSATFGSVRLYTACTITAVFKQLLSVQYDIDTDYSSMHFNNDLNIFEDSILGDVLTNPAGRLNVTCKVSGYEFKYWAVEIAGVWTEFDIYTDPLKAEYAVFNAASGAYTVKFKAVFGPIK